MSSNVAFVTALSPQVGNAAFRQRFDSESVTCTRRYSAVQSQVNARAGSLRKSLKSRVSVLSQKTFFGLLESIRTPAYTLDSQRAQSYNVLRVVCATEAPAPVPDLLSGLIEDTPCPELKCASCGAKVIPVGKKFASKSQVLPSHLGTVECLSCKVQYADEGAFTNMLLGGEAPPPPGVARAMWNPLLAAVYETPFYRLPGRPDFSVEYAITRTALWSARDGAIVDLSCGPARMGRALRRSNIFPRVYGCDASEAMLREAQRKRDGEGVTGFPLLRGDVRFLPFADGSLSGVYALLQGAALHLWVDLEGSIAEVFRVLRPGGVFVASTFTTQTDIPALLALEKIQRDWMRRGMLTVNTRWQFVFTHDELIDVATRAGLVNAQLRSFQGYSILTATKPE